jgi:hypothetical protein
MSLFNHKSFYFHYFNNINFEQHFIPLALQLRVSFGLLNNQPPFFIFLSFHFHFTEIIIYLFHPSADVDFS